MKKKIRYLIISICIYFATSFQFCSNKFYIIIKNENVNPITCVVAEGPSPGCSGGEIEAPINTGGVKGFMYSVASSINKVEFYVYSNLTLIGNFSVNGEGTYKYVYKADGAFIEK